jgi:hypothetical protein
MSGPYYATNLFSTKYSLLLLIFFFRFVLFRWVECGAGLPMTQRLEMIPLVRSVSAIPDISTPCHKRIIHTEYLYVQLICTTDIQIRPIGHNTFTARITFLGGQFCKLRKLTLLLNSNSYIRTCDVPWFFYLHY